MILTISITSLVNVASEIEIPIVVSSIYLKFTSLLFAISLIDSTTLPFLNFNLIVSK